MERTEKNDAFDAEIMVAKKTHGEGRERYGGVTCTALYCNVHCFFRL